MTLGHRLKKARERKRFTQLEVADKLGISNGTLSGYERNYRDPDTDMLVRLADLYEVELNWLLGKVNKKESAVTLPESEIELFIKEREDKYGVILQDDPIFQASLRNLIDSIAQTRASQQKPYNHE